MENPTGFLSREPRVTLTSGLAYKYTSSLHHSIVYVYACHVHICVCVCTCICTYLCAHKCVCIHAFACEDLWRCVCVSMHVCLSVYMCMCVCARRVCVCARVCTCMCMGGRSYPLVVLLVDHSFLIYAWNQENIVVATMQAKMLCWGKIVISRFDFKCILN